MRMTLPSDMQAVRIDDSGRLVKRVVALPRLRPGEVLVKISAAPVNPSDLARIAQVKGTGGQAAYSPGIEGSGRVVACAGSLIGRLWMGRRVACSALHPTSGTWAGYLATPALHCVPLPEKVSDEQGAMMLVNPLTAVAFISLARQGKHRAIVNTAAASALGAMLNKLASREKLPLIHVVRNRGQMELLISRGYRYVLCSSDEGFDIALHDLCKQLNSKLILDAVGGNLTRRLMAAAPPRSDIVVYGNLSGEFPETDHRSLVTEGKKLSGFFLASWLQDGGMIRMVHCILQARKLLQNEISIPVQARFDLARADEAISTYLAGMGNGKVLLLPNGEDAAL